MKASEGIKNTVDRKNKWKGYCLLVFFSFFYYVTLYRVYLVKVFVLCFAFLCLYSFLPGNNVNIEMLAVSARKIFDIDLLL